MIVVLADDLSGAAELAGAALNHGLRAEVQTRFTVETDADVVCVDTDSRLLPAADSARVVGEMARAVTATKPSWVYKKCDSVLRGNVLAEIRALMAATGKPRATLISANPSRGRIIRGGEYFVEGVPLPATAFAFDPSHPRHTARVAELLGGDLTGIATPDAGSVGDLLQQAEALSEETLPAGGVDFFAALLVAREARRTGVSLDTRDAMEAAAPVLLVCGSAVAWPQRAAVASGAGIPLFPWPHDCSAVAGVLRETGRALVGIGDGPLTHNRASAELLQQLAASVKTVLAAQPAGRVLLEGGSTAAAIVRALGWMRLTAIRPAAQGVGVLAPAGVAGVELCIKPGSYDWPAGFWPPG